MASHFSSDKRGGRTNGNAYRHDDEAIEPLAVSRAIQGDGGAGGISGTGQALPHHGFDVSISKDVLGIPVGDEAALPMPENGATYQTGGKHLHRERLEQPRKSRAVGNLPSDPDEASS